MSTGPVRPIRLLGAALLLAFYGGGMPALAKDAGLQKQVAQADGQQARELKKISIGIGTCVSCTMQQAFRYYDEKYHIIRDTARNYGYDVTVRWLEFPTAPEELAAFASGDVSIGFLATFPLTVQLQKGQPFRILTNNLGYYPWYLMVRKNSGITKLEDLKGKIVGLALGSTAQFAFQNFVFAETGKTVQQLGISLASQPLPLPTMPPGLAGYVNFSPALLPALESSQANVEPLFQLAAPPQTGPAYVGPLGKGAGIPIPSASKSPWAPEGFVALRNFFVTKEPFLAEHRDLVKAFVIAQQRTIKELHAWTPAQIVALYPKESWTVVSAEAYAQKAIANDLLYKYRDWVWPGEDSVKSLLGESQQAVNAGILPRPLSIKDVEVAYSSTIPLLKEAYEATGSYPDSAVFADKSAKDLRGPPVWDLDLNNYKDFDVRSTAGQ